MRVLNLYAGIGGNRKLWKDVEVTAVEREPKIAEVYKRNFPYDKVIVGDAHEYLLNNADMFEFIWSSPPCQTHTKMMKATRHKKNRYVDMSLYQEVLFLQHFYRGLFVVENVVAFYEPLIKPSKVIGRHSFWTNFNITPFDIPNYPNFIKADSKEDIEGLKKWIGIHYEGNIYYGDNHSPGQVLRNCVHPETGLHILNCAMNKLSEPQQIGLFQ